MSVGYVEMVIFGKVYIFKVGGIGEMLEVVFFELGILIVGVEYNLDDVVMGVKLYINNCVFCYGVFVVVNGGVIKNLGYVDFLIIVNLEE